MLKDQTVKEALRTADERIAWVLSSPSMSAWLKDALHAAMDRDPVDLLNDLEILDTVLRHRCQCLFELSALNRDQTSEG